MWMVAAGLTAQVDWLCLRVGGHPALSLHSSIVYSRAITDPLSKHRLSQTNPRDAPPRGIVLQTEVDDQCAKLTVDGRRYSTKLTDVELR